MTNKFPVITIDGPSGSGKGTIGQLLANDLHWNYLDSGALYRALAWAALQTQIALDDEDGLVQLTQKIKVEFLPATAVHPEQILLDGLDVTLQIRREECGTAASKLAALPKVRDALLTAQRDFCQSPGLVTDGRDMGSVVFPKAEVKIFLVASAEERAKRRYYQLKDKGINVSLDALCQELLLRDNRDQQREVAPLKPTEDAVVIDTTGLSIAEVLKQVKEKASFILQSKGDYPIG